MTEPLDLEAIRQTAVEGLAEGITYSPFYDDTLALIAEVERERNKRCASCRWFEEYEGKFKIGNRGDCNHDSVIKILADNVVTADFGCVHHEAKDDT